MNNSNEPVVERPPATSDLAPLPDAGAITSVTTIGKFKIPTDVLNSEIEIAQIG